MSDSMTVDEVEQLINEQLDEEIIFPPTTLDLPHWRQEIIAELKRLLIEFPDCMSSVGINKHGIKGGNQLINFTLSLAAPSGTIHVLVINSIVIQLKFGDEKASKYLHDRTLGILRDETILWLPEIIIRDAESGILLNTSLAYYSFWCAVNFHFNAEMLVRSARGGLICAPKCLLSALKVMKLDERAERNKMITFDRLDSHKPKIGLGDGIGQRRLFREVLTQGNKSDVLDCVWDMLEKPDVSEGNFNYNNLTEKDKADLTLAQGTLSYINALFDVFGTLSSSQRSDTQIADAKKGFEFINELLSTQNKIECKLFAERIKSRVIRSFEQFSEVFAKFPKLPIEILNLVGEYRNSIEFAK